MTSEGSTRCQLARVCFELAPTVTEKTWSVGSLDCRSDRNMSTKVSLNLVDFAKVTYPHL